MANRFMVFADVNLKKQALFIGLALGAVLLVINTLMFYFITTTNASLLVIAIIGPVIISFILPVFLTILACNYLRKKIGGYWTYRQAATGIFILFMSAYLVSVGGKVVFFKTIDPNMDHKIKTTYIVQNTKVFNERHYTQDKIIARTKEINEMNFDGIGNNVTFGAVIETLVTMIILLFALALLFANFYKREGLPQQNTGVTQ